MDALDPLEGEGQREPPSKGPNWTIRARAKTDKTGVKERRSKYLEDSKNSTISALHLVHVNYKGKGGFEHYFETSEWMEVKRGHFLLQQLVNGTGTLAPPLPDTERKEKLRAAVNYSFITRIPKQLIAAPGEDGQLLRKGLLSGATIVFFTPGYEGKRFIYEHAKSLGVSSVIIDGPGSWAEKLVEEKVIKKFVEVSMEQDSESVFEDALAAIKQLDDDPVVGKPVGICTFCELSVPVVARLCNELGLPSSPAGAIDIARNKHKTRQAMREWGLATVANTLIKNEGDLADGVATVGFPAVLKPISGAASLGVKKVYGEEELYKAFAEVKKEMEETVVSSGALVKTKTIESELDNVANAPAADIKLPAPRGDLECHFMLEEYLDGPEVDVDVVMSEGEAHYVVVVDNGPTVEPYFNETWGLCPSQLEESKQKELREMAVESLKCCGFTTGIFHVELKYTSRGPRLIEINARMGGGQVRETHRRVYNVDLVEETLFACVGIPCRPDKADPPLCALAYNYVNARKSGKVASLLAVGDVAKLEDVVYSKPLVREGDEIVGPEQGMPTWIADIMVSKQDPNEALNYVLSLSEKLDIPVI